MSEKETDFLKLKVALRRGLEPRQLGILFREYYKKHIKLIESCSETNTVPDKNAVFFNSILEDLDSFTYGKPHG